MTRNEAIQNVIKRNAYSADRAFRNYGAPVADGGTSVEEFDAITSGLEGMQRFPKRSEFRKVAQEDLGLRFPSQARGQRKLAA